MLWYNLSLAKASSSTEKHITVGNIYVESECNCALLYFLGVLLMMLEK